MPSEQPPFLRVADSLLAALDRVGIVEVDAARLVKLGVKLAILFGSRATGKAAATSDTDVGLFFAPGTPEMTQRAEEAHGAFGGADLDLVVLNHADPLLQKEAAMDAVVLFEAHPGALEEFRLRAVKMWMDTAWMRRMEADALRDRYP